MQVWMQGRAEQRRLSALQRLWKGSETSEAPSAAFSLRFFLTGGSAREFEGNWNAEVVLDVLNWLDGKPSSADSATQAELAGQEAQPSAAPVAA